VKGLTFTNDNKLLSCGTDGIKLWDPYNSPSESAPIATWQEGGPYTSLSFHRNGNSFAASSGAGCINVWDLEHSTAPQRIQWPNFVDTITDVCFNQVETSVIASVAADRSIMLFDLRTNSTDYPNSLLKIITNPYVLVPVMKTVLKFASNRVVFNPMEAMNLAVASEGMYPIHRNSDVMLT